jgi:hypothetical protein
VAIPSRDGHDSDRLLHSQLEGLIVARLEDAGRVLLALPAGGYSTHLRTSNLDIARDFQAYGWTGERPRVPVPSSIRITRMEAALQWLQLISDDQVQLRRIVGLRMLVHPLSNRHLYSWRKVGEKISIDHRTAKSWHERGIGLIGSRLRELALMGQI